LVYCADKNLAILPPTYIVRLRLVVGVVLVLALPRVAAEGGAARATPTDVTRPEAPVLSTAAASARLALALLFALVFGLDLVGVALAGVASAATEEASAAPGGQPYAHYFRQKMAFSHCLY
jgi:hypothetical protein